MGRIGREKHYTCSAHLSTSTCLPASVINHPVRFPELLQLFQWEGICVTPGRGRKRWPGSLSDVGSSDSGCVSSTFRAVQSIGPVLWASHAENTFVNSMWVGLGEENDRKMVRVDVSQRNSQKLRLLGFLRPFPRVQQHGGGQLSYIGDLSGTDRDATDRRRGSRSDRGPFLFFLRRGVAAILRHWNRVVGHIGRCSPRCAANHGVALS